MFPPWPVGYSVGSEEPPMNGDYGPEEAAMQSYLRAGERRAASLGSPPPFISRRLHSVLVRTS